MHVLYVIYMQGHVVQYDEHKKMPPYNLPLKMPYSTF